MDLALQLFLSVSYDFVAVWLCDAVALCCDALMLCRPAAILFHIKYVGQSLCVDGCYDDCMCWVPDLLWFI
jgi:hypothetical protein